MQWMTQSGIRPATPCWNKISTPATWQAKRSTRPCCKAPWALPVEPDAPLFAVVSRLTEQKGLPLVLAGLDEIVSRGGQLLVLGSGDTWLEQAFSERAKTHAGRVAVKLGYDESLAHRRICRQRRDPGAFAL